MRAELRATLLRGELRAKLLPGGVGCGLFMWQNLRCGLTAGQVIAGRAAGSDFQPAQGPYSRTTYEFLSAIFSQIWRRNCRKLRFFVNAILETVKIRIFVNMASKFRKLRIFVNAILETVKIRKFVNMAYFSP